MEYCLTDAKEKGKSGVCMLGSKKRKNWLSDQSFAKKFGFEVVDATDNGYELLALSFDGTMPKFAQNAKKMKIESEDLTIYFLSILFKCSTSKSKFTVSKFPL